MLLKEWHYFFIFVRHSQYSNGHQAGNGRHFEFETCSMEMIQRSNVSRMVPVENSFPLSVGK